MKRYKTLEMQTAYEKAGYRERYAMENGNKREVYVNSHRCLKFTYSSRKEYQDANGALWDTVRKQWIG
mgnify:CR=1 FL=1